MSGPECPVSKELCEAKMSSIENSIREIRDDIGQLWADYHSINEKVADRLVLQRQLAEHEAFISAVKKYAVVTLLVLIMLLVGLNLPQLIALAK